MDKLQEYKKVGAPSNSQTNDVEKLLQITGNLYATTVIVAKRADQISVALKEELNEKLDAFAYTQDTLEEVMEDAEQIELSKSYERLPKPTLLALQEFMERRISYSDGETLVVPDAIEEDE